MSSDAMRRAGEPQNPPHPLLGRVREPHDGNESRLVMVDGGEGYAALVEVLAGSWADTARALAAATGSTAKTAVLWPDGDFRVVGEYDPRAKDEGTAIRAYLGLPDEADTDEVLAAIGRRGPAGTDVIVCCENGTSKPSLMRAMRESVDELSDECAMLRNRAIEAEAAIGRALIDTERPCPWKDDAMRSGWANAMSSVKSALSRR